MPPRRVKKKTGEHFESVNEELKKATRQPTRAVTAEESQSRSSEWETRVQEDYMKRYNLSKEKATASEFIRDGSKQSTTDDQSLRRSAVTRMRGWASPSAMQRFLDSPETKASIAKRREEERMEEELEEVEDLPEDECWGSSDDDNNIDKKTEEGMIISGGAKKEEGTTSWLEGSNMEGDITTWEGMTAGEKKTTGPGSKKEEKAQVKRYPRIRTEQESGKVDSQGSQRWRRRKREEETPNSAAEGGGGLL
jgi:hypothetical protein